ncbi:3-phosphoshikimate 1-carboxyvinyltransferase [Anaerococcus senegalensis]|uniref:3-phosphoshikimate 1-carboxyvinyltransferase n=1 Tax=Anaerococcus senegalensis TaxID=1288120 RepID=UPI0003190AA7|nr:3-phosphoshikimate 1-carboxyvinyltransferase [Anaerococcus senegalensis]MCI4809347.1 3-phosphoshikimate 1-carboxyvinyltransferase [Clostridioides difficile]HBG1804959.1 3-phosphoshikimate 1-carboxyvinyltransferase [Clostridioides difficile]HBG6508977.1 3-phosphoshikimate 1-carboxyvinyltransferase [Clostridioides difficile]HBG8283018.1 3-phosphoshikimate 1-carboxyvinyltransferase [Clostridioides difficile]
MNVKIKPNEIKGKMKSIPSKSLLHRAIILSGIAKDREIILEQVNTISEDIEATLTCIEKLGAKTKVEGDSIRITSLGNIKKSKVELHCKESGTTLRLLLPLVSTFSKEATVDCSEGLRKRPIRELIETLEESGLYFKEKGFPINISGNVTTDFFKISGDISSQYVSGLLLLSSLLDQRSSIYLTTKLESRAYVNITIKVLRDFGIIVNELEEGVFEIYGGRDKILPPKEYQIEGDWSNAAFFLVGGCLGDSIKMSGLNLESSQGDKKIVQILKKAGAILTCSDDFISSNRSHLNSFEVDFSETPDLFPILSVVAALSKGQSILKGGERLKLKESNRIESTFQMLKSLGADVKKRDDGLIIQGKEILDGGIVNSFNDHRIVMSATMASIKCKEPVSIVNAGAVKKSYPNFFDDFKKVGGIFDVIS